MSYVCMYVSISLSLSLSVFEKNTHLTGRRHGMFGEGQDSKLISCVGLKRRYVHLVLGGAAAGHALSVFQSTDIILF